MHYYTQPLSITINASSNTIDRSAPLTNLEGDRTIGGVQHIFNTTAFEHMLSTGVNPDNQRSYLLDTAVLEQYPRLKDYNLTWPDI